MMRLKPSYAARYGDYVSIHAYTDEGEEKKKQFLRDGRRYLLAVARQLKATGFASQGVRVNPAGIAVSGEVWFRAWHEEWQQGVSLHLAATSLPVDRADQLALVVNELSQWVTQGSGKRARVNFKSGPNLWLSASFQSDDLAQDVLRLLRTN